MSVLLTYFRCGCYSSSPFAAGTVRARSFQDSRQDLSGPASFRSAPCPFCLSTSVRVHLDERRAGSLEGRQAARALHGLHYGSCVFEGERAYNGVIYKSRLHSERFRRSAELLDFEIPYSVDEIEAAKALTLEKNGLKNSYVRPVAWRGSEMMAVAAQHAKIHVAIAMWDWPSMFDMATKMKGIRLDVAEYRRPDPACAPCASKAAGLYMICTISKHRAERARLCRRHDAGLAGARRRMHRRQHLLHQGWRNPYADRGLLSGRHYPADRAGSRARKGHCDPTSAASCRRSLRALKNVSFAARARR